MKQFLIIFVISLFSLSCERREIIVLNRDNRELKLRCDSLSDIISLMQDRPYVGQIKYYIIASEKVLLESGVITRVSGLSREMKVSNKFNKKYFVAQHMEYIDTLIVEGRDVKVLGLFDPDSYTITKMDIENHYQVVIRDKNLFWDNSNYLIITFR